jgi:hypothetical protein
MLQDATDDRPTLDEDLIMSVVGYSVFPPIIESTFDLPIIFVSYLGTSVT